MGSVKGPRPGRFQEIISSGDRASTKLLTLYVLTGTGAIGVTTSRKIGNRARRNRVKRRIREVARTHYLRLAKWDSIVLAREAADQAEFVQIAGDLGQLIDELERRWEKQSESS